MEHTRQTDIYQVTRTKWRDETVLVELTAMVLEAKSKLKVTKVMLTVTASALTTGTLATPTRSIAVMLISKATAVEYTVLVTTL